VYSSNESTGDKAEYLRDGLNWEQWKNNFTKLSNSDAVSSMHSMCTINTLSLEGLVDFLNWCLDFKKQKQSKDAVTFTLNILRFPNFQSVLVLPQHIRILFATQLQQWLEKNRNSNLLHTMEIDHLERLIDYLTNAKNQLDNVEELRKYFKNFYNQYDKRRGKDFAKTFPILGEWYRGL
jgi:hypothetical protein